MKATAVVNCSCKHSYQDKTYGTGRRVMNATTAAANDGKQWFRCTVCGTSRLGKA